MSTTQLPKVTRQEAIAYAGHATQHYWKLYDDIGVILSVIRSSRLSYINNTKMFADELTSFRKVLTTLHDEIKEVWISLKELEEDDPNPTADLPEGEVVTDSFYNILANEGTLQKWEGIVEKLADGVIQLDEKKQDGLIDDSTYDGVIEVEKLLLFAQTWRDGKPLERP